MMRRLWTLFVLLAAGLLALSPRSGYAQAGTRATPTTSSVVSPHGADLKEACASCHSAASWKPARITTAFKHAERTFPLTGAHGRTTCLSCHTRLDFKQTTTNCASCHTDPHNSEFGANCARCHNTRSFVDRGTAVRTHQSSRFPLRGAHALATCESCHLRTAPGQQQYQARGTTCASCHLSTFRATASPNHAAARFSTDCTSCHTISTWTGATFDHNATKFPLTGRHQAATCKSCHTDGTYTGRSTTCVSCHQSNYTAARTPRHDGFPTTCESCHSTAQWNGARFDHDAMTRFPLTGGHRAVSCASCHADKVYKGKPTTCVSCHQPDADKVAMPNHAAARFGTTCESCHSTTAWRGGRFDHATTRFPLTGLHTPVTCAACHAGNVYAGRPSTCLSCHMPQYDGAAQPNHKQLGFPTTCEACHTTSGWNGGKFDHSVNTRFPLTGAHTPLACKSCHFDGVYKGKPTTCIGCHQQRYDATTAPHHAPARFGTNCESCHTTQRWPGAAFSHTEQTRFPLLGKHTSATCLACHGDRVYAGKPSVCASCHMRDYDASTSPNHRASGTPTTCESCHSANGWRPASFDHNATRFPLAGAHRAATCTSCHADGVYRGKPTACASCHQNKYDGAKEPDHRASGFPTTCESCHTVNAWTPASFDHNATRFPLQGAHRATTCASCHADGVYRGKPTTCVSCHQNKYDTAKNPDHRTSGFPTTCESCHTVNTWTPATFNHSATRFPLAGAHRAVNCAGCHGDGVYRGKPTTCVSCHQANFTASRKPNHAAVGFATNCESCHSVNAWTPATYNHSLSRFPLTGAHRTATCAACHSDGVYRGKPMTCAACHQSDYNTTTAPNHVTLRLPTTCESCHSTTQWRGATFNHDPWFPIYSGKHRGKWTTCSQCHTNSANYREFTCLSCHEHNKTKMDSEHRGRSGYRYESSACLSCHARP